MNTKHTPGEWSAQKVSWTTMPDGSEVDQVYAIGHNGTGTFARIQVTERLPNDTAQANARLIAAAPELLEALKEAKSMIERMAVLLKVDHNQFEGYTKITSAIQKAEQ